MTLEEIANFICGKVNQTEAEDIAACKGFIRQRHSMIYQDQLWRDSVAEYVQVINPDGYTLTSNWLPSKGILLCPPDIERVLAVRTDSRALRVRSREYYYRRDFDSFAKVGTAGEFVRLRPCVWETEAAGNLYAVRAGEDDSATAVTADLADADGVGISRVSKTLDEPYKLFGSSDRIETLKKPTSTGIVKITAYGPNLVTGNYSQIPPAKIAVPVTIGETYIFSPEQDISGGIPAILTYSPFGFPPDIGTAPFVAEQATVYVSNGFALEATPTATLRQAYTLLSMASADTTARKRQRIRLIEIPSTQLTLRVLAKLVCPILSDGDSPAISNVDNCLIAFGQGDMLQRERQYSKAATLFQEGTLLVEQLKRTEVVQEAHNQCIQPDAGYAEEYDCRGGGFVS